MSTAMASEVEFDAEGLAARVAKASVEVLKRMGAYVRTVARRKVHTSDRPSTPGTPPHILSFVFKCCILFGLGRKERSVVIGPSAQFVGSSAAAHEFGGRYRRERYPKRPLMGPSLKESVPHLARMWRDAVK